MPQNKYPPYFSIKSNSMQDPSIREKINAQKIIEYLNQHGIYGESKRFADFYGFSSLSLSEQMVFSNLVKKITADNFNNRVNVFIPGREFKSISVTGNSCDLHCEHCNKKYLTNMKDASTPEKLRHILDKMIEYQVQGCLISGGCTIEGKVPLLKYKDILKEYKDKTNLIFNFHTGLVNEQEIEELAEIPPDVVSFDFSLDEEIIHDVYHMENRSPQDYIDTIDNFIKKGIQVIPHICVGLNFGSVKKELEALKYLQKYEFDLIVFIVLIPPNDNDKFTSTNISDILDVFYAARLLFPLTELSLGCMRPRGKDNQIIEELAVRAGFNRFVIPSKNTLKTLKENNYIIDEFQACCAIPLNLYHFDEV